MTALRPVIVVRSSVQNSATIPCDQRLFQGLSTVSPVRAPSGRNRFPLPTHQNGWATRFRGYDGRDGRPSIRPERLLRGCCCRRSTRCQNNTNSRWAIDARTVASCGRCRLLDTRSHDDHGTSAVILRQHTTPFRPMIVPFDDLELVHQSMRTLEPPHTHKFPRVNAQDPKLGQFNLGT